jgi:hypothetical protein
MFRIRLLALIGSALLAGLAVATIATAEGVESATPGRAHAFGAGTFGPGCWQTHGGPFCVPFNYTFRLLGISEGQSGSARGVMERRNNVTGGTFRGDVKCMTVSGNEASIGGVLTSPVAGDPFLLYVRDNGTLSPADGSNPDEISALSVLAPGDPDLALLPDRFPQVCPTANSIYGHLALTAGDFTVSDNEEE